jgi:hypothetical protein
VQLNWQMNWKSTAAGTVVTALVAWLAAPSGTLTGPAVARSASTAVGVLPAMPNLDVEATRLAAQRDALAAATSVSARDPFRFAARPAPRVRQPMAAIEPAPVVRRSFQARLAGIATDVVAGVPEHTAIFTGPSGVVFARRGDSVDGFRVEDVTDRDVSLTSLDDGHTERLPLDR